MSITKGTKAIKCVVHPDNIEPKSSMYICNQLDNREMFMLEIAELQAQKREAEYNILDRLLADKRTDCFTVNWNAVKRAYK